MISVSTRECYKCILHLLRLCFHTNMGSGTDAGEHMDITLLHSPTPSMPKIGAKENNPNELIQMIVASWIWPRHTDFTAQKIMASCFLFKKQNKKKSYHMRKFFHKPQTLHRLELQTTILIEDACVDTDARLQPHTIGTIWKNG